VLDSRANRPAVHCDTCAEQARRTIAPHLIPKASVIIGTFDCEPFVEDCVRSVMNQTEKDIEIIVVDDGSTDQTLGILKKLQSEDSRILVHSLPHSGFPGPTRNHGICQARGRYIAFLDGDDLYHPRKIERILAAFETEPETDVVIHDLLHFDRLPLEDGKSSYLLKSRFLELARDFLKLARDGIYLCGSGLYKFMSLYFVPFCTDSIAIRKDVLFSEPAWFREDLRIGEDGELWLRLAIRRRFVFVYQVLSYYRQRSGSLTTDQELFLLRTIQIHEENLERGKNIFSAEDLRLYHAKIANLFFNLGYQHFKKLSLPEARAAYRESLRLNFQATVLLAYIKTFAPQFVARKYHQSAG
jgi:glycosyltransferase involved in cell wall biosynthesis